ncbi:diguanylate cyclase [Brenneria alni]|uniref:diguanylate cyclase n=1 Tax=Brenneria alni TaxID=71656 RepID=A0A421DTW5_9GAMM|nr:GGDEF domain-containing protein [Brenneria alni]RLM28193.1 diguanylate cyclase [Brenneria alni]
MNSTKYKILEFFSHPISAFILFGLISIVISITIMHKSNKNAWQIERQNLDTMIKTYGSHNSGGDVLESDTTSKTGRYTYARIRTLVFNTRDVSSECINRLSASELKFNDMAIIRICQTKLPSIGEYAGKGTLTFILPILSSKDELLGIRIRTNSEQPPPSILDTFTSAMPAILIVCIALLCAVLGSLLSILAKKYLIELPITARYDDLTGYLRRDAFFMAANKALGISNFSKSPVCVILIDIDHFKKVNDTFGHSAGDEALKVVADVLKKSFRREDIFGRIGGDEFAIVLPNINLEDAYIVAERAKLGVSNANSEILGNDVSLAVSIGLVEYLIEKEDLATVMKRADEKLYVAKITRNTVAK